MEWLGQNLWAMWLTLALLLAAAELLTLDFALVMLAVGAGAGSVTAVFLPDQWVIQLVVAVTVAVAMLFLLRPTLLAKIRSAPGYRSYLERLVGREALVVEAVSDTSGRVDIGGDEWTARTREGRVLPVDTKVRVDQVDGVIVHVTPR